MCPYNLTVIWTGISTSPAATRRIAAALASAMEPVPRAGLFVILLGDLGAGKTVFAGGLFHALGVPAAIPVVSPTFTVARGYRGRVPIHHVDAYHVRSLADLEAAGFEEMGGEGRVTCVEWGDRIVDALPADRLEVTLSPVAPPLDSHDPLGSPDAVGSPDPLTGAAIPADPPRRVEILALSRAATAILERARPNLDRAAASAAVR